MMRKNLFILFIAITTFSCDYTEKVPIEQFAGKWELQGRPMFEGIEIEIKNIDGRFNGQVIKLNDNSYIQQFVNLFDTWVTAIKKRSDYQFYITERKVASELFGLYGLDTSTEFEARFEDKNTIILIPRGSNSNKTHIQYIRIQ